MEHRGRLPPSTRKRKRDDPQRQSNYVQPMPSYGESASPQKRTPTKRPKKQAEEDIERRLKPYRNHPPQNVMVKYTRVMTQRMFLVERSGRKNGALEEEFSVLGSTGNVYVVNINMVPTCTCPDFLKNYVHCKHILFILVKVLKIPDPLWYQAAFLTSELEGIFTKAEDSRHSVSDRVLQHYKSLKSGNPTTTSDEPDESGRRALEGDCPICFEDLTESSMEDTVYCKAMCGNNIHKECFNQWARSKRQEGAEVTCVYCRTKWDDGKKGDVAVGDELTGEEGYMNLGKMIGASSERDTSTYHYRSYRSWGKHWG